MPTWKHIISLLWIGAFLSNHGWSQSSEVDLRVATIQFEGAVPKYLTRHARDFELIEFEERVEALKRTLLAYGYLSFSSETDTLSGSIVYTCDPGSAYAWGSLEWNDEASWVLSRAGAHPYRLKRSEVSPLRLERAFEKGITYLENHGFPFASFQLDSVEIVGTAVNAKLVLEKGRYVSVDSLVIEGDLRVREAYLSNFLGVKEGKAYDESAIKRIPERLDGVRFIRQVRPPLVVFEEDQTKVRLFLNKKSASSFDGVLGFLPDPDRNNVLITGDVRLHLENALRQGELIDLEWRRLQTNTQELDAGMVTPFVFNSGFSIDGALGIYRRDTSFTDISRQIGVRYALGAGDYLRLFFDRQTTNLISTSQYGNSIPPFLDRAINSYGVGLHIQEVDAIINPSKGWEVDLELGLGTKQIIENQRLPELIYEDLDLQSVQWKGALDAAYYISPINRLVWHQRFLGSGLVNDQLFNNEAFRIGGLRTARGFDEQAFFATSYAILRSEIRYQLDQESYLFTFFDGTWYENTSMNRVGARRDTPYGFGVGLAFGTTVGNFNLTYALGSEQSNPAQLRASKIHFGYLGLF